MIEKQLAKLISRETDEIIDPLELPEIIDQEIKSNIKETIL